MGIKLALLFSTVRLFQDHCDGEVLEQSTGTECVVLIEVSFCLPYKNYDQLFLFSLFPRCKKKQLPILDQMLCSMKKLHLMEVKPTFIKHQLETPLTLPCIASKAWIGLEGDVALKNQKSL